MLKSTFLKLVGGQRIRIPADKSKGWAEEFGTLRSTDEPSETMVVEIDPQYRSSDRDDGLREVHFEHAEDCVPRAQPKLATGRCCWVCGKPGGGGFTTALRHAGYDVPRGTMAYAHYGCMARANETFRYHTVSGLPHQNNKPSPFREGPVQKMMRRNAHKKLKRQFAALTTAALNVLDCELTAEQRLLAEQVYELANKLEVA